MDYTQDEQESALSKLEWSSAYFTVSEFLKKFPLPQIAKVAGGFYGEDDESTLVGNQILCLHSIKSMEKVHGRDSNGRDISVLMDCKDKIEVLPSNSKDIYESVEELCAAFPRYVRVSQVYYSSSMNDKLLNMGDKLHLKSIHKSDKAEEKLTCVNQNGQTIELSKDCKAGFQPLKDGKEYYLSDVVKKYPMPVSVQFVDPFSEETPTKDSSLCQPLGIIYLRKKVSETVVIATSIRNDGQRSMVHFSRDVDINLVASEDMLNNSTDYAELCHSFHQDVEFQNICPDIYEYLDVARTIKEVPLDVLNTKKVKLPHLKKSNPKRSSSKQNTKIGEKLTSFLRKHSERKESGSSKSVQNDQTNSARPIYADPNNIYDEIAPKSAECNQETIYTELDPTYVATTSEYEKPLKQAEQPSQAKPETPAVPNITKQPANCSPPTRKPSSDYTSDRPHVLASNSLSCGGHNPPPVATKPPSRSRKSTVPKTPKLSDKVTALPDSNVPNNKPQLPERPATPDKKPAVPDRKPFTRDLLLSVSGSPTMRDSRTVSHARPPKLPKRSIAHDKIPALPTSSSDRPPPLPNTKKPVTTPALDGDEIHQEIAMFPSDLSGLSVADVSRLLRNLRMESCVDIFKAELVDGDMLASMDKESLESLDISSFHVKKLLKFIGGWRPNVQ